MAKAKNKEDTKVATDFEKIINAGRERKRNEDLAAQIFSKDGRRHGTPIRAGVGPSLASRVGVKKRVSAVARLPPGNINGEWLHDLHGSHSTPNLRAQANQQQVKPNSLAARIHAPGTKPLGLAAANPRPSLRATKRASKLANALDLASQTPAAASQVSLTRAPQAARGLVIRGLAGPFAVMAQNFVPGTTAADIESAMTPVGGLISSCRLVKTHPIVIAEIVFESKEGADRVIETFNNQTADGRLLHVYLKPGYAPPTNVPTGPRSQQQQPRLPHDSRTTTATGSGGVVVDGSHGFDEPMAGAGGGDDQRGRGGLYSDSLVTNRRGRGFQGGRGRR